MTKTAKNIINEQIEPLLIRAAYANQKRYRVTSTVSGESRTKQAFRDESNINNIMAKYQKTGIIDHMSKHSPTYGDATPISFLDAQLIVKNAETMFNELPSSIRRRFQNNPAQFLEFIQDPKNKPEMAKLGLLRPDYIPPSADVKTADKSTEASKKPTKKSKEEDPDD